MAVERFEDLVAWQKATALTGKVYEICRKGNLKSDFRLASQLQSCSVSIMANIAEGFERGRRAEFSQFLSIAKGSCGELRSHLFVALDAGYLPEPDFEVLKSQSEEVSKIISGLRRSIVGWEKTHE